MSPSQASNISLSGVQGMFPNSPTLVTFCNSTTRFGFMWCLLKIWWQRQHHGGIVDCKSFYRQTTSSEPMASMAMVPPRSLPKFGAFGAMEKCLWSISMKFGDNDNAMGVSLIASPCTIKPQVQSLYHPWLWSPGGLYRNLEHLELCKSVFGLYP